MGTVTAGTNATAAEYNDVVYLKNYVMNSNFDVWQRGTTSTNPSTNAFLADRWRIAFSVASPPSNVIHSRQKLVNNENETLFNSRYYYRVEPDGAGTFNAAEYYSLEHRIENGVRLLAGTSRQVTVSYYARSTVTSKKLGIFLSQNYGTTGSPTSQETINGTYDTLSSGWVRYSHTFTLNTLAGKTFGTDDNDYLRIVFMYAWGSDYTSIVGSTSTLQGSGSTDITQVQVTIGTTTMEYKPPSYEEELRACQRYCYVNGSTSSYTNAMIAWGWAGDNTTVEANLCFPVQMRTFPTITATGSDWVISDRGSGAIDCTGISLSTGVQSTNMAMIRVTTAGHTQYRPYAICADGTAGRLLILDAEL